jgi:Ca2+-binding EF-hand superfamily protein
MKKFLIAAATLMAGTAALAQTAPVAPPAPPSPMAHPMADKVMTRAETVAMVREHFGRMDTNRDGAITTAEVAEGHAKFAGRTGHPGGGWQGGDPNAAFDRLDSDRNGSISRDEFAKGHEQRIERRVEIREKRNEAAKEGKRSENRAFRMHRMGGLGGSRMIVMADSDHDGKITLAEAEAMALQHFDQMDSNHDGQVTPEERRSGREMMIKKVIEEKKAG